MTAIRLGLIGDNIAASQSPALHRCAGSLCGLTVTYDLLVPAECGVDFAALFERCRREGYRGLNITYPYKERVVRRLTVDEPDVRVLSACNTVVFGAAAPVGLNTDYTGFMAAFRQTFGAARPGVVAMVGAGGVGRALAFALAQLGASALRLFDVDPAKAEALRQAMAAAHPKVAVIIAPTVAEAARGADGLVNATPLGMEGIGGTAFPSASVAGQRWAFDAVYTPEDTAFVQSARAAGLAVMTGYELYFHQGVDAFRIFTGHDVDQAALRTALAAERRRRSGSAPSIVPSARSI